jgi:hypothetical protein
MMVLLREAARPAVVREHRLAPWFAVGTVCFGAAAGCAAALTVPGPAVITAVLLGLTSAEGPQATGNPGCAE